MRNRRLLVCLVEAAIVLVAVYFEPTHVVRGTLWGEAFFDGRPTSWWGEELEYWDAIQYGWAKEEGSFRLYYRKPSRVDEWSDRILRRERITLEPKGPSLLGGDAATLPVLRALRAEGPLEIQYLVDIGIKNTETPP